MNYPTANGNGKKKEKLSITLPPYMIRYLNMTAGKGSISEVIEKYIRDDMQMKMENSYLNSSALEPIQGTRRE